MYKMYYQDKVVNKLLYNSLRGGATPSTDSITALYSGSVEGGYYDPNDLSTVFQDAEGLIPVTAPNQLVGKLLDKSGNGNHLVQTVDSKKPKLIYNVLKKTYGLSFDGVDDVLSIDTLNIVSNNISMGQAVDLGLLQSFKNNLILNTDYSLSSESGVYGMRLICNYDNYFQAGFLIYRSGFVATNKSGLLNTKYVFMSTNKPGDLLELWVNKEKSLAANPTFIGSEYLNRPKIFAIGYLSKAIVYKSFFIGKQLTDLEKTSIANTLNVDLGAW